MGGLGVALGWVMPLLWGCEASAASTCPKGQLARPFLHSHNPAVKDAFAAAVAAQGDRAELRAILEEVCRITGMGFAAVARVTEDRLIAAQVLDKIEFG